MWIRVYPNWENKLNSKKGWKKKLFLRNQRSNVIYPNEANEFMIFHNKKKKRLLCEFVFVLNDKWALTPKIDGKGSFSYETKASILFNPMRRLSLWCPILKRKEIAMWIHVCPNWETNFNSKKWWRDKLFLWNQSINIIYPSG